MALFRRAGRFGNSFRNNQDLQKFVLTDVTPTGTSLGRGSYGSVEEVPCYVNLVSAYSVLNNTIGNISAPPLCW